MSNKTVVSNYDFIFFKRLKTIITNHNFKSNFKIIINYYDFEFF